MIASSTSAGVAMPLSTSATDPRTSLMARIYSNENIPLQVVEERRKLGHDVLTTQDAANANRSVPGPEVLGFATAGGRLVFLVFPTRIATARSRLPFSEPA